MAKLIKIDGEIKILNNVSLEGIQLEIGGCIEILETTTGKIVVNSKLQRYGMPVNEIASIMAGRDIVGSVILIEKDAELIQLPIPRQYFNS